MSWRRSRKGGMWIWNTLKQKEQVFSEVGTGGHEGAERLVGGGDHADVDRPRAERRQPA